MRKAPPRARSQLEEATQMLAEPDSRLPSEQRATVRAGLALAHALTDHAGAADRQRPPG